MDLKQGARERYQHPLRRAFAIMQLQVLSSLRAPDCGDAPEVHLLTHYKEVFYGLALGLGAMLIDAGIHAWQEGISFWVELVHLHGGFRLLFVAFGVGLGWLLWKQNSRERQFRQLADIYRRFHEEIAQPSFLIRTKCEELLWLNDADLPSKAREHVRFIHEKAGRITSLVKEKLTVPGEPA